MLLSDAPFFTLPPPPGSEGVDFLGTRAVNLNLMAAAIPGINNVVSWIRPFSLIAWMVWRFESAVRGGETQATAEDFERFTEKVESLYVWSHQVSGVTQGIPGMRQNLPRTEPAKLSFASFGQRTEATSLFAAVNYGPASKAPFGLGFIAGIARGLYAVTPAGQELAEAFDQHLRSNVSPQLYIVLSDVGADTASTSDAKALYPAWRYDEPTEAERRLFLERLFRPKLFHTPVSQMEANPGAAERTAFIALIRGSLGEDEHALTIKQLRKKLCTQPVPSIVSADVPVQAIAEARAIWQVLQVRQAQRLGLEALFAWTESVVWQGVSRTSSEVAQSMIEASRTLGADEIEAIVPFRFEVALDLERLFDKAMSHFEALVHDVDSLYASMEPDGAFDMFEAMSELEQSTKGPRKEPDTCIRAVVLLALSAVFAKYFAQSALHHQFSSQGAAFRIPLLTWARFAQSNRSAPLARFLTRVLETFVVSQHFAIAAARFADEKSRLRFTIDDAGLTSLLSNATESALNNLKTEH
jgi:hypothetical protein